MRSRTFRPGPQGSHRRESQTKLSCEEQMRAPMPLKDVPLSLRACTCHGRGHCPTCRAWGARYVLQDLIMSTRRE